MKAELVIDCRHHLGEGPVWYQNALWWVNITAGELHAYDPKTREHRTMHVGGNLGCAIPTVAGQWLLAKDLEIGIYDPRELSYAVIGSIPETYPNLRFNDGKVDAGGRLWVGTLQMDLHEGRADLFSFDGKSEPIKALAGVTISNGIAWSMDLRRMYYIDTLTCAIDCFDYQVETGSIDRRRTLIRFAEGDGYPDGMAMDEHGDLWVSMWGGSCVVCVDVMAGKIKQRIDLPVPQPSSCCFGGEHGNELWITSAHQGMNDEQRLQYPHSGSVFKVQLDVKGAPIHFWK